MLTGKIDGSQNFTWEEATKSGLLLPDDEQHFQNIKKLACYLDSMREFLGNRPVFINSWYRTARHNRKIGGSSRSQHLTGLAVDFYCPHMGVRQVYSKIDAWHSNKGGLGRYKTHVHIDLRGYKARWISD